MKKVIIGMFLAILPTFASAAYEPERIKAFVSGANGIFEVTGWKQSDNGNVWVANTSLSNVVLSIDKNQSQIISYISTSTDATKAIIRCLAFGHIGVVSKNDKQRFQLAEVANSAIEGKESFVTLNDVRFAANKSKVGGVDVLSCQITPANN